MEENYLLCASIPNAHVHASMWSFLQGLRETSCGDVWNEDQSFQAKFALSSAHSNMPMVFESQNDFFKLRLETEIAERVRDWHSLWRPSQSRPGSSESVH